MKDIIAYTDGSCVPNPGPGGWAWSCYDQEHPNIIFYDCGGCKEKTTNNRMELMAFIELIKAITDLCDPKRKVHAHVDSQYVLKSLILGGEGPLLPGRYTGYMKSWNLMEGCKNGGIPLKNGDLWNQLHKNLMKCQNQIILHWVKGHSGNPGNDFVDDFARKSIPVD